MLTSAVQPDQGEELVLSGLERAEIYELREWFCYTKPMGPSFKVIATPAAGGHGSFCVVTAGNEPGRAEEIKGET
jgi:hypothetical protein